MCKHLNHNFRPHDATLKLTSKNCKLLSLKWKISCFTIYDIFFYIFWLCHKLILRVLIGWNSTEAFVIAKAFECKEFVFYVQKCRFWPLRTLKFFYRDPPNLLKNILFCRIAPTCQKLCFDDKKMVTIGPLGLFCPFSKGPLNSSKHTFSK